MVGTELWISGGPLTDIEIGATGLREIVQNVRTILATRKGSVMGDRHFGVAQNMVDDPLPVAVQRFRSAVVEEIQRLEPRVKVLRVEVQETAQTEAADGILVPKVLVRITDKALL